MRRVIPVLLTVLLLLLSACSPADGFEGGRPISKEELASLSAELFNDTAEPVRPTPDNGNILYMVYWSDSGSVYHYASDCRHLKDAKSIHAGSIRDAREKGKEKACSACAGT